MLKLVLGLTLLLAGVTAPAETLTRNDILAKFHAATRSPAAEEIRSARIVVAGDPQIEYLRKGNRSLQRENGELAFVYDGKRSWTRGEGVTGGDPSWFMQFAFSLESLPELFGRLVLSRPNVLLGQRNAYREVALIEFDPESGLFRSVTTFRLENQDERKVVTPTGFRQRNGRTVTTGFRIGGKESKVESIEWNIELDDSLFVIPEKE